jgi:hypothetical protein
MPEEYMIRGCLLCNVSIALLVDWLSLLTSKIIAHLREFRNIFILLSEKFKRISHVERDKLDLKEIRCEV